LLLGLVFLVLSLALALTWILILVLAIVSGAQGWRLVHQAHLVLDIN